MKTHLPLLLIPFLMSCSSNNKVEQIPTPTNPYPGNPAESFAPQLVKDNSHKNLALHRRAYASSSWDYNLTAQNVTDGVIESQLPAYFDLSTSRGPVPRQERDWIFDLKITSGCTLQGTDDYIQLDLYNNLPLQFDKIQLVGRIEVKKDQETYYGVPGQEDGAIHPIKRKKQVLPEITWYVELQGSSDGNNWQTLDSAKGSGMNLFQSLNKEGDFSHYRVLFSSPQAESWMICNWDFFTKDQEVQRVYDVRSEVYKRDNATPLLPPFSSCWMSNKDNNQWIYVDLGTRASISSIHLHWLSEAPEGELQLSDDAKTWRTVAQLTPEISLSEKARFVRLNLTSGAPYILTDFEVMGTDGVAVQSKPQPEATDCRLDLAGGNWRLQRANYVDAEGADIASAGFDDSEWIVATVPATVLTSYINVGAVPDPNYSDNQLQISESFFSSDFWYRDSFIVPASYAGKKVFLNFDGINWKADIYLNGKSLGRIDGAFMRGQFEVDKYLHEGDNYIAVKIIKNSLPGSVKEQTALSTDANGGVLGADNPTFHASIGWDWIPTIRGRNIGIWNDVYLTTTGNVRISDPFVRTELNLPDTTRATVFVEATLSNLSDQSVEGKLVGNFAETAFGGENISLAAGETRTVSLDTFVLENPRLWWPAGYGSPELYDTHLAFEVDGQISDQANVKTGIRQMTYKIDASGALNLYVNGRRFIGRGGNWGFAESNLAYRGREYDIAVRYHADENFTMIRNWVGQIGDEEFYEACDLHGVMIWQDFWLANPWDGPDPYDEAMFMANAKDYIKRIRNHASVGLYCGRNEGMPPATIDNALREQVAALHPGLQYISHSAANEVSGGGPYRALPVADYFNLFGADRFHSERGMPNVMNYENLAKTLPADRIYPQNSLWGMHDFTLACAQYGSSFNELLTKGFGEMNDAQTYCKYAQWINYDGYRAMFEGRGKHRQGLLLWMSHPAWPSLVWQTYDYFFEPTAAYFGCKKASEPLHVQYNPLSNKVEVVNMSGGNRNSLEVRAQIFDLSGKLVWSKTQATDSQEDSTTECMEVEVPETISDVYFIRLELSDTDCLLSENFYWQGRETGNYQALRQLHKPTLDVHTDFVKGSKYQATTTITNRSDVPALMLRIKLVADDGELILPVLYSDNYISLMPGESKVITTRFSSFDLAGRKPSIVVE